MRLAFGLVCDVFFIIVLLYLGCTASADDPNAAAFPFREIDQQESPCRGMPNNDLPSLLSGVFLIVKDPREWVAEHRYCLGKAYAVLSVIGSFLARVPFENQ
jgi:hypothetical protein